jgi:hypothetical protein
MGDPELFVGVESISSMDGLRLQLEINNVNNNRKKNGLYFSISESSLAII